MIVLCFSSPVHEEQQMMVSVLEESHRLPSGIIKIVMLSLLWFDPRPPLLEIL